MTTLATLIILGASVRAAAESAVRAGIEPYCIDLFADADTRLLGESRKIERYPVEFLSALQAAPDAPWLYTGSLENYPRLIARMAEVRPLLGNGPNVLARVRDPIWLASALRETGVRYPETLPVGEVSREGGSWLLKPRRSGGGLHLEVAEFARIQGLQEWSDKPALRDRICQQFVPGEAFSASFLAAEGRVEFLGAAGQWNGPAFGAPRPFQYAGSFAPLVLSDAERDSLARAAEALATQAGLRGLFGLDLVRGAEGLWLIEVNPRYTASMELLEALRGQSLIAQHCEVFNCTLFTQLQKHLSKHLLAGNCHSCGESDSQDKSQKDLSKYLSTMNYHPGRESGPQSRLQKHLSKHLLAGNSHSSGEAWLRGNVQDALSDGLSLEFGTSPPAATIGKRIVYADQAGIAGIRFRAVIDAIATTAGVIAADIPTMDNTVDQDSPICTVLAVARNPPAVAELLAQAASQIRQSLDPLPVDR